MKIKIIASSGVLFESNDVDYIHVPTTDGQIGILPKHMNLVSTLEIGEIVLKERGMTHYILLNGGLLQVKNDQIIILANEATMKSTLVKSEIENALKQAQEHLASGSVPPAELVQLERKLRYEKFKYKQIDE